MKVMIRSFAVLAAVLAMIISSSTIAGADMVGHLAPAPSPTSDGTAIDQGIAYVLMLVALLLTYIIH